RILTAPAHVRGARRDRRVDLHDDPPTRRNQHRDDLRSARVLAIAPMLHLHALADLAKLAKQTLRRNRNEPRTLRHRRPPFPGPAPTTIDIREACAGVKLARTRSGSRRTHRRGVHPASDPTRARV